jgi:hypothetical protein
MIKCYNCGNEFPQDQITREHIPAQNIFGGYGDEYKKNRIVVPACFECNNQYSLIDQEIRDAVGIMNDKNQEQNEMTRKSVKSIMRRSNWVDRLMFSDDGRVMAVNFSYDEFKKLHIKNFKGLFYHKYGRPLPEDFEVEIIAEGDEDNQKLVGIGKIFFEYVNANDGLFPSGHEDIFMYNIKTMNATETEEIIDTGDVDSALCIVGVLVYHKNLTSIVIAARKDFIEKVKP